MNEIYADLLTRSHLTMPFYTEPSLRTPAYQSNKNRCDRLVRMVKP